MSDSPFFIVGFQRSGTTLLRVMLDAHPEVAIPLDTVGLWARYEEKLAAYGNLHSPEDERRLVGDLLAEERIRLWEVPLTVESVLQRKSRPGYPGIIEAFHLAYAAARGKRRWGDKDPGNMERIDQLVRWFPDGRVIHIIRDGRDACLSQTEQDFGFEDILECAECWREQVQWVRRIGGVLGPERYAEVLYEDLVAKPEAEVRRLAAFLGLAWSPAMLEYHKDLSKAVPEEKRHIWPMLSKPPQASNAARWKREFSASQRIAFEKRAAVMLRPLGYETLPRATGGFGAELHSFASRVLRAVRRRLPG